MKDADIDYSDMPPLGKTYLTKATVAWPPIKKKPTTRLESQPRRSRPRTSDS